jgi:hypothetical protein
VVAVSAAGERFTHRPGSVRNAAALLFALITTGFAGPTSSVALLACAIGVVGQVVGLTRGDRRIAGAGSLALLGGVFVAGVLGAPPVRLLPGVATAIIAWDLGMSGFAAREELGDGRVERAELLQVATATVAGSVVPVGAYAFYRTVTFDVSLLAVFLLLVAATALGLALRE